MKETKCEIVRRELEELKLTDECSVGATQHLRDCADCREFHQRQTKLRQIVGSLGTVEAPPDFDFRLRARLANESPAGGFHLRSMQWSFASKGFAVAAAALLFVVGVVYFKNIVSLKQRATNEVAEQRNQPGQPAPRPVERPLRTSCSLDLNRLCDQAWAAATPAARIACQRCHAGASRPRPPA